MLGYKEATFDHCCTCAREWRRSIAWLGGSASRDRRRGGDVTPTASTSADALHERATAAARDDVRVKPLPGHGRSTADRRVDQSH